MQTVTAIPVQVILTFEDAPQDLINTKVIIPTAYQSTASMVDMEADVVEQILTNYKEVCEANGDPDNLAELVKLSLCYTRPKAPPQSVTASFEFLIRNNAKYFFQPNQRDMTEREVVRRMEGVATKTRAFA